MTDNLQTLLNNLIQNGQWSNPAIDTLITDYTRYHLVLVVVGGLLVFITLLLSIVFGVKGIRAPRSATRQWTFEKKAYLSFAAVSFFVSVMFGLIVAANASNVIDPHHGFSLLVDSLGMPQTGTPKDQLYQAFGTWIQSDGSTLPAVAQTRFAERISFHSTKALVSAVLLLVFVVLSRGIWRRLIQQTKTSAAIWRLKENVLLLSGVATVSVSLLLAIIVMANMQAAVAPIALTLLYG